MKNFTIKTRHGTKATLSSDDTFTLAFGNGFDEQGESTSRDLAAALDSADLFRLYGEIGITSQEAAKIADAIRLILDGDCDFIKG